MEGEINNFIIVWLTVFASLCFCYLIAKITNKGITRFLFVLPIVCLFFYLPLRLHSVHLGGTTAFFIGWLATFKLLLFAFDKGPLCSDPSISLKHFVAVASLPIKIQKTSDKKFEGKNTKNSSGQSQLLGYTIKGLFVALLLKVYDYGDVYIHGKFRLFLYCFHIYFFLEIILAAMAAMVKATLGVELEPQFTKPYLSTSLQDFWGRRWNLMVTSILRPTVYIPISKMSKNILGHNFATSLAVLCTFVVSGIMHELMFYYLGRSKPTGEVSCFFILHGFCVVLEVGLKKLFSGKVRLPWWITGPLTAAFVLSTSFQMFVPQFTKLEIDVKAFEEYAAVGEFVKNFTAHFQQ